ncbi:putative ribosomal protein [Zalerion maritima]|uniref:Ribosomal protein n=1 Tax=Zalerion maritima TaxID=339359 RepID=A0AAD5RIP7_9PEZI|nr:putative ribosomal protein [Zalerion maritima]
MEAFRPILPRRGISFSTTSHTFIRSLSTTPVLQKQTSARLKRYLNISPHTSFLASYNDPSNEQIVFNPPSSAPSVFNTPFKFLPKSDPRRRAALASHLFADPTNPIPRPGDIASAIASAGQPKRQQQKYSKQGDGKAEANRSPLPPTARKEELLVPKHHLEPQDVEQIRRLRASSPSKWSVMKLAKKFQCAETFVMACVQAPDEHQKKLREKAAKAKERWGTIRRKAREERSKRKKLLFSGRI